MDLLQVLKEKLQTTNDNHLADELEIPVSVLRIILKHREDINKKNSLGEGLKTKKRKVENLDNLEEDLLDWLYEEIDSKRRVNVHMLYVKAQEIAKRLNIKDFSASNAWMERFKYRNGVVFDPINKKPETEAYLGWLETVPALCHGYEPHNIFNADEFGLFFKLMPDKYYEYEGETCYDGKSSEERLTVLACANSDGSEKLRLLVIGKSKYPRSFGNVRSLLVTYDGQSQAWITEDRFTQWLKALDDDFRIKGRHIILFIDDCSAHPKDVELKNIKLVFLPPKETDRLQPMEGIIKALKRGYRTRLILRYRKELEDPDTKRPLTVHDAILNLTAAWEAIKPETIQNCFKKVGFKNHAYDIVLKEEGEVKKSAILQDFPQYSCIDKNVATCAIRPIKNKKTQKDTVSDGDEDEEEATPTLSNAQALTAINDLRRYVTSLDESEDALQKLNYIENLLIDHASKPLRPIKKRGCYK